MPKETVCHYISADDRVEALSHVKKSVEVNYPPNAEFWIDTIRKTKPYEEGWGKWEVCGEIRW